MIENTPNPLIKIVATALATAVVVGLGTYYLVNHKATTDKAALQSNIDSLQANVTALNKKVADLTPAPTTTTPPAATPADPTANWKSYTNTSYGIAFKYPAEWGNVTEEVMKDSDGPAPYDYLSLLFDKFKSYPATGYSSIAISKFSNIAKASANSVTSDPNYQTEFKPRGYGAPSDYLAELRSIFTAKAIRSSDTFPIRLPSWESGINWLSKLTYIANTADTFRGAAYYDNDSQDSCSEFVENIIVMTDNKGLVFQLSSNYPSAEASKIFKDSQGGAGANTSAVCQEFKKFTQQLPAGGDSEQAVQNFNSTYKLIAQSITATN